MTGRANMKLLKSGQITRRYCQFAFFFFLSHYFFQYVLHEIAFLQFWHVLKPKYKKIMRQLVSVVISERKWLFCFQRNRLQNKLITWMTPSYGPPSIFQICSTMLVWNLSNLRKPNELISDSTFYIREAIHTGTMCSWPWPHS